VDSEGEADAIGAAQDMSEATERVRERAWLLARAAAAAPRTRRAEFRRAQSSGETDRRAGGPAVFTVTAHAGYAVVAVAGQLDISTAAALRQHLFDLVEQGYRLVVADLTGVDFLDSGGLGALVGGLKRARRAGGQLRVVATVPELAQLFRVTGVYKVLPLYETVEAATAYPSPD
jgi:anti-sigma B factor antagonist